MSETTISQAKSVSTAALGGPGPADPAKCSALAIAELSAAAAGMGLNSMQLDVSSKALGDGLIEVRAQIDKRTRSIAFVSVEALAGGEMVFRAQALFGLLK